MDKCPFCNHPGFESTGRLSVYGCGTMKDDSGKLKQTEYCKDRQIANLEHLNKSLQVAYDNTLANLNDLKERLEAWRKVSVLVNVNCGFSTYEKLKDLGEL